MSFDCRYKAKDNQCLKLKKECSPGIKGCVLYGRYEMPFKDEGDTSVKQKNSKI